nr:4752_t:CDS:2 [Entrophospora candida]
MIYGRKDIEEKLIPILKEQDWLLNVTIDGDLDSNKILKPVYTSKPNDYSVLYQTRQALVILHNNKGICEMNVCIKLMSCNGDDNNSRSINVIVLVLVKAENLYLEKFEEGKLPSDFQKKGDENMVQNDDINCSVWPRFPVSSK